MRILLTGVTGFAGSHLAEALLAQGQTEIVGVSRRTAWPPETQHLALRVGLRTCDLCTGTGVEELIRAFQPDQVYHLAGYANAGQSYREPDAAWAINLTATRHLYDAIHRWGGKPRILFVSSGLVYGDPEVPDQAHDESALLRPANPYASSKAAADLASYQYTRSPGLDIVRARPFNHIGPRQAPQFAVAHFAKQIAAIERGLQPPLLETGDLSTRRDLTDVRDMVRAYVLLMEHGHTGEVYNIGTGIAYSMKAVLHSLLAQTQQEIQTQQKSGLRRLAETHVARANASKIQQETGWRPRFTIEQTLVDTLAYWREVVSKR